MKQLYIKSIIRLFFLILFANIFFISNTFSQEHTNSGVIKSVKPTWVEKTAYSNSLPDKKDISDGQYLLLFEVQTKVDEEAEYFHYVRKLVNESGVQSYSQLEINFNPAYQSIYIHNLIVRRGDNEIQHLNDANFKVLQRESNLAQFVYDGYYTAFYLFEDVRAGDVIEYDFTIKGYNPIFGGKYFESFYFGGSRPNNLIKLSVIFPPNRKPLFREFNNPPKVTERKFDQMGSIRYTLESKNNKPITYYNNEPAWYDVTPKIQISEILNWSEVIDWALKIFPDNSQIDNSITEQAKILGIKNSDDKSYFEKCVRFVQDEIRYMSFSASIYSHKPHNPSQIIRQRYGDCKDKSVLLCALLAAKNISAYPVLVNTVQRNHTNELSQPSYIAFDHCVVLAELDNQSVFIDPTISMQRGDLFNTAFPDYGEGLIIRKGDSSIVHISPSGITKLTVTENFILGNVEESALLEVKSIYSGYNADVLRSTVQNTSRENMQRSYLDYYANIYDSIEVVDSVLFNDHENENTIIVTEKYQIRNPWLNKDSTNEIYEFKVSAQLLNSNLVFLNSTDRAAPVAIKYPFAMDYTISVKTPEDWNIEIEKIAVNHKSFEFEFETSVDGDVNTLNYHYRSLNSFVSEEDIVSYNQKLSEVDDNLVYSFTWNKGLTNNIYSDSGSIHFLNLIVAIMLSIIVAYIGYNLYRISIYHYDESLNPKINSWLWLPAIGLVVSPFIILNTLFTSNYFNSNIIENLKTSVATSHLNWDLLLVSEMSGNILLLAINLFCLLAFFKRRDITPIAMCIFYSFNLLLMVADSYLLWKIDGEIGSFQPVSTETTRAFIACLIWIPAFLISQKSKSTFVIPYNKTVLPSEVLLENTNTRNLESNDDSETI